MKQYVQKREPIRAVQWLGEKTPELIELLGEHGHFSTNSLKGTELRLGSGGYVLPGYWICSSSGEDFMVLSTEQLHDRYEEVHAGPTTQKAHEEAALEFLKQIDALLVEGLKLSPEQHTKVFRDRNRLVDQLRELLTHQTWLGQREAQDLRNRIRKELDRRDPE